MTNKQPDKIKFHGAIYVSALSTEPYKRALERIQMLKSRGVDPQAGTLKRLLLTENPNKIIGIYQAAKRFRWAKIMVMAAKKYKDIVGTRIPSF